MKVIREEIIQQINPNEDPMVIERKFQMLNLDTLFNCVFSAMLWNEIEDFNQK